MDDLDMARPEGTMTGWKRRGRELNVEGKRVLYCHDDAKYCKTGRVDQWWTIWTWQYQKGL